MATTEAVSGIPASQLSSGTVELSIVIPCLNEAESIGICVEKATRSIREAGITGEVIVADNGSRDGSREISERLGARVVAVPLRGYGNALMGGIAAARGRYILMGDADDSYDFLEMPKFLHRLREGAELVQGCRLPSGGGGVRPGAMPFLHRWIGNPALSRLARTMFSVPVHDVYCGMRAFRKDLYERLNLRCTGMEFATEMIIKASLLGARIAEVPITLHPDARKTRRPHLRTFHDGWRTLRFYLIYSPRWLFVYPAAFLILLGMVCYLLAMPGIAIGRAQLDVHTLLFGSLFIMLGYQSLLLGVFAKTFAIAEGLLPPDPRMTRFYELVNLEKGLAVGAIALLAGVVLLVTAVWQWVRVDFGPLNYPQSLRWVIPGVTLTALGCQTILSSFLISMLGMRRL